MENDWIWKILDKEKISDKGFYLNFDSLELLLKESRRRTIEEVEKMVERMHDGASEEQLQCSAEITLSAVLLTLKTL